MDSGGGVSNQYETRGVMYVVTGKKYIQSAIKSARSVHKYSPDLQIHLFANWQECGFDFSNSNEPFTSVDNIESPHYRSKVDYSVKSPFDRTLYLDSDTRVLDDITPIFDLLDRFDMALAHAPNRITSLKNWRIQIPVCFPQFNSGVIAYRKSDKVWEVLHQWIDAFHQAGFIADQITLREIIWLSDLRVATLPPEYNMRSLKYFLVWDGREARPRILHLTLFHHGFFWILKSSGKAFLQRINLLPLVYNPRQVNSNKPKK
jgi:hypothetical protein